MTYIPERNDIVWLDFEPSTGREQNKRRPALVLSPQNYNISGLAIVVPITSGMGIPENKGFMVSIPKNTEISGQIVSDQIKNLDWKIRNAERITSLDENITADVIAKTRTLLLI